jgi:DNA-nicking Smr family endonuclease
MNDDSVEIPINGVLDLHTFRPSDLGTLIPDYLDACREQDIFDIRLIHGKGTGTLRDTVHSILRRRTDVIIRLGDETSGGWGATLVTLKAG